jgi:hypothetical protein
MGIWIFHSFWWNQINGQNKNKILYSLMLIFESTHQLFWDQEENNYMAGDWRHEEWFFFKPLCFFSNKRSTWLVRIKNQNPNLNEREGVGWLTKLIHTKQDKAIRSNFSWSKVFVPFISRLIVFATLVS